MALENRIGLEIQYFNALEKYKTEPFFNDGTLIMRIKQIVADKIIFNHKNQRYLRSIVVRPDNYRLCSNHTTRKL